MIRFNRNAWLKPYIDVKTDLRKKVKNDFEKDFFKLMNNAVFDGKCEKTWRYKTCHSIKKELFGVRTKHFLAIKKQKNNKKNRDTSE